jgi:hypothetical protein
VYKLLLFLFSVVFAMMLHAFQMDQELALRTLFWAKHSLNRAAHAAAQQLDPDSLSRGVIDLDEAAAELAALQYLQANLQLDEHLMPLPDSFLQARVEVLAFEVIRASESFPYEYTNERLAFKVTLRRPGVVMAIRVEYPRLFSLLGPVSWELKGAAELVEL